jgi:hypothetical protein
MELGNKIANMQIQRPTVRSVGNLVLDLIILDLTSSLQGSFRVHSL